METLPKGDIELTRLTQPPQPPELIAKAQSEVARIAASASRARLKGLARRAGAKPFEGPQIPLLIESALGRAYLASGPGRAIAMGSPAATCPMMGAALSRASSEEASRAALSQCLTQRAARGASASCGCRLVAAGDVLLTDAASLAYARAVTARLTRPAETGRAALDAPLIAEERLYDVQGDSRLSASALADLAAGARTIWLLAASGPVGLLTLSADGAAELWLVQGPRQAPEIKETLRGVWRAEGFRRGRLARRVALSDGAGRAAYVFLGYEPREYAARRAQLIAEAAAIERPIGSIARKAE